MKNLNAKGCAYGRLGGCFRQTVTGLAKNTSTQPGDYPLREP